MAAAGCVSLLAAIAHGQARESLDTAALVAEKLTEVRQWSMIPGPVRDVLVSRWKDELCSSHQRPPGSIGCWWAGMTAAAWEISIADPKEPYQQYDFNVTGKRLPFRRLALAAKASKAWLVCYEQGGFVGSLHLVVVPFRYASVWGEPVWIGIRASSDAQWVTDLPSLRAASREHRLLREYRLPPLGPEE
ncbi:MAG TPA: hypothetical protein VHR45_19390 [Thermoanaerobaculia bacterium]|nr:hypothetical protein [Thermoanaerobaculia bacterium]